MRIDASSLEAEPAVARLEAVAGRPSGASPGLPGKRSSSLEAAASSPSATASMSKYSPVVEVARHGGHKFPDSTIRNASKPLSDMKTRGP